MTRTSPTALTTRSDGKTLPAMGEAPKPEDLLDTEARRGAWRIVELFSTDGAPFEVELSWSSGSGAGASARLTIARAGRVSVFARALRVRAANLSDAENRVGVTVADGQAATRNVLEVTGELGENATQGLEVPAFAHSVTLELADHALLAGASLRVLDGQGTLRSTTAADEQSSGGVPIGGASKVEIQAAAACAYRAIFHLAL
jgi:hypothetical protein